MNGNVRLTSWFTVLYATYDSTNIDADEQMIKTIGDVEEKETVGDFGK